MKKLLLSLFVILCAMPVSGQEVDTLSLTIPTEQTKSYNNILGFSPLQLPVNVNLRIKYEYIYGSSLSAGIIATYHSPQIFLVYTDDYWGIAINPFLRYYFRNHAPTGWYFQVKFVWAHNRGWDDYDYITTGFSLNLGGQYLISKRWTIDFNLGYTFAKDRFGHPSYYLFYPPAMIHYMKRPYNPISGLFNLGYRF